MERTPVLAFQIRHEASPARSKILTGLPFSDLNFGGFQAKRDKGEEAGVEERRGGGASQGCWWLAGGDENGGNGVAAVSLSK